MITQGTKAIELKVGDEIFYSGMRQEIISLVSYVDVVCIETSRTKCRIGSAEARVWFLPSEIVHKVIG